MTEPNDIKALLKTAIQMEKDGYDFYMKAASQTSSHMGETIFKSLAQDELLHLEAFQKMAQDHIGRDEWDALVSSSNKYADLAVFPKDLAAVEGANPDTDELDALHMGMDSEKESIDFYSGILAQTDDPDMQKMIELIIQQEKDHYLLLQEEFNHLTMTGHW